MLLIENVEIGYTSTLLKANSIRLEQGKLYALLGRNGIGKSTLLHTIMKNVPVISGSIFIQEKSIESLNLKEIGKKISFVNATFRGIENLKVHEFLLLGRIPYTNLFGITQEEDEIIVNEVVELLKIDRLCFKYTNQLSDGEKQLVAIAQALVQQTKLLLLDEPTAFLDYENKWKILQTLKQSTMQNQLCTVFSTHDLEMALKVADELLLIDPITKDILQFSTLKITIEDIISRCFPSL